MMLLNNIKRLFKKEHISIIISPCFDIRMPAIGVAYLCEYLRSKGIFVELLDLNMDFYHSLPLNERYIYENDQHKLWVEPQSFTHISGKYAGFIEEYAKKAIDSKSEILCFFINPGTRNFSIEMAKYIRKHDKSKTIIFGGSGVSTPIERELVVPRGVANYFILGDAEDALHGFIMNHRSKKSPDGLPGLIPDENIKKKIVRATHARIDHIIPTYREFDISRYKERILPILFTRGCVNSCVFCDNPYISGPSRARSVDSIFSEIRYHATKNKIDTFYVTDPALDSDIPVLEELCDRIISSGLKISWEGMCLVRKELTDEIIGKMAKAGCRSLMFGIETGSDRILKKMAKRFTIKDAERVLAACKKNNIKTLVNFFAGFPGEVDADIEMTIGFMKRNRPNIDSISKIDMCFVVGGSALNLNRQLFKIKDYESMFRWTDENGADFDKRKKNMLLLCDTAESLGLNILSKAIEIEL